MSFVPRRLDSFAQLSGLLLLTAALSAAAAEATPSRDSLDRAAEAIALGRTQAARSVLLPALETARAAPDSVLQSDVLVLLAASFQADGNHDRVVNLLNQALDLIDLRENPARAAVIYNQLGAAHRSRGDLISAERMLNRGRGSAAIADRDDLLASIVNDLGIVGAAAGDLESATFMFEYTARLTRETNDTDLAVTAAINLARVRIRSGEIDDLEPTLTEIRQQVEQFEDTTRKARHLLAVGALYRDAQLRFGLPASWRRSAYEATLAGRRVAVSLDDARLLSFADGYIGRLYEDEQRYEEALIFTLQAAFGAQSAQADDSLYLWEWQTARLHKALGRDDEAVLAYRRAIRTLGSIREELLAGSTRSFRQLVGPVFFELADLLLQRASTLEDPSQAALQLNAVRNTLEQVKLAEVREYFADECVLVQSDTTALDRLSGETAVIYPVLLEDRTELLVSLAGGMRQFTTPVGLRELTLEVRAFRRAIETPGDNDYSGHARQLYEWLIAPMSASLVAEGVDTLVVVPDGPLRTIPMSALYDGERFMIERYSFATTPGLTLTNPRPLVSGNARALVNGLTEGVQGFPPLPAVSRELGLIEDLYPADVFRNQQFVVENVEREVAEGDYSIVHLATHGQFDRDHAKSFLLAYDDKITMDRLQSMISLRRYQEEPLELLVLSACQTAAGDDRAALGLAGVAIKAGARSALATLWFVNDESTSLLVSKFYEHLKIPTNTKAEALRKAQLELIGNDRYGHPSHWAPFLLIGNWL